MMKWNLFIDLLHFDIILMTVTHIFPPYSHYYNAIRISCSLFLCESKNYLKYLCMVEFVLLLLNVLNNVD